MSEDNVIRPDFRRPPHLRVASDNPIFAGIAEAAARKAREHRIPTIPHDDGPKAA